MADIRQQALRVWNLFGTASTLQFTASLGGSGLLTTAVTKIVSLNGWLDGWYLVCFAASLFLLLFAAALSVVPRIWQPKGPLGDYFGSTAVMVGLSEDMDERLFRRTPQLKRQCAVTAKKVRRFFQEQEAKMPKKSGTGILSAEEEQAHGAAWAQANQRALALYDATLRHKVNHLLRDARAMFYGPVPAEESHPLTNLRDVAERLSALEDLAERLPETYSSAFHLGRIERLRKLKHDGLTLADQIGKFADERKKEETDFKEQLPAKDAMDMKRWERERNFDSETETRFMARFGGDLLHVYKELQQFGLSSAELDRSIRWHGIGTLSWHEIPALPAEIGALCRQIPYD